MTIFRLKIYVCYSPDSFYQMLVVTQEMHIYSETK